MVAPRRKLVTEDEFLALEETTSKMELVDGEVIVSPSPTVRHQTLVYRLRRALGDWVETSRPGAFVGLAPLDVRVASGRILQPDVFVVLEGVAEDQEGPVDRVPELCVEVLSRDRVYDRVTKRYLYAEAGVRELWLVEPYGPVERRYGEGLATVEEVDGTLRTPLLEGFSLEVPALVR